MPDIASEVITIIKGALVGMQVHWSAPEIEENTCLSDLKVDAVDMVCIACALDEHFGFELSDDQVGSWERVADVIASVRDMLAAGEVVRG